jgi:hypothetical protein
MSTADRIIRDPHANPDTLVVTNAAADAERARLSASTNPNARVLVAPALRFPLMSGDPASPDGTQIAVSELGPSAVAFIQATAASAVAGLREVTLKFPGPVAPGTAVNIQTGAYSGGGPATLMGDVPPTGVSLPPSALAFLNEGAITVLLNGQGLTKGVDVIWVSPTQVSFTMPLFANNEVTVTAPLP